MRAWPSAAGALLWAGCGAAALPLLSRHSPVDRHVVDAGDWRLVVARNGFSGEIACRLRARDKHAVYEAGAVGFRFRGGWDIRDATYRVDGGVPHASRDDRARLIALGVPLDSGGMDNPSRGVVWIPFSVLANANSVAIEPRPDRRVKTFHLRGLRGLLDLAHARGCTPDSRFGP